MTIRQLYYTSCQHGRDGMQGFQVNAASAGLTEQHEDLGLRLSAYRPSPAAPVLPTPEQIERFPVAVGYRLFGDVAVLFHSRYLGADFTGRQGNYFAHILVLDAPDRDLDAMLPIEAWGSPLWRWQQAPDTQLPQVDRIAAGPLADLERIRTQLLAGQLPEFGALLSAVQDGLSDRVKRIVVVAPDTEDVARALTAVTRSLPTKHAHAVSFTTFTSSPADTDVLVAGTTPDVEVSAGPYGDQIVVTLATGRSGDRGSHSGRGAGRYASVLHDCWARGVRAVAAAVELAARVSPQLQPAELDQFADLVELVVLGSPGVVEDPLPAVEFALRRLPSVLTPALWQLLDDHTRDGASFDHLERWSEVFVQAGRACCEPGPELESGYVRAALSRIAAGALDPARIWLPAQTSGRRQDTVVEWAVGALKAAPELGTVTSVLDTLSRLGIQLPAGTELHSHVIEVVLAELLNPHLPDALTQLQRLPDAKRLLPQACAQLQHRLTPDDLFDTAVGELLSPPAASLLASLAPAGTRCAMAASLALARARRTGRVTALLQVVDKPATPGVVERFATLLWPDLPTAEEGVQLCQRLDHAVLAATRIPQRLLERLIEDARGPGLSADDEELADLLATHPIADSLSSGVTSADCVRWGTYFNSDPPASREAQQEAVDAVRCTAGAATAVASWTLHAVADWMLALPEPTQHAPILLRVVRDCGSADFLTVYSRRLAAVLASAKPTTVAAVLPAVVFLAHQDQAGRRLLDTTCKNALIRRRKRDLDAIGQRFERNKQKFHVLLPKTGRRAPKNWPSWWKEWRDRNIPRSAFVRFVRRYWPGGDK